MLRRMWIFALFALVVALIGSPAQAKNDKLSQFGRMFPGLPALNQQTNQQLADLAQTMLDPNADSENNVGLLSAFTYFGQFVDHDLTLDTSPSPTATVDPMTLDNHRTFRLDLDSVYGGGPTVAPQLYEADKVHFRVQNPNPNGVPDLPRNADGSAILVEARNDENQILSQIHLAFLRFHNAEVDRGLSFRDAQARTIDLYQTVVLTEFLPHIVGQATIDGMLSGSLPRRYDWGKKKEPMTPVEFSVAAYRFGHSQVRRAYEITTTSGKVQVFSLTQPDLRGGRQLPADRKIDWGNFDPDLIRAENTTHVNISRKIDPLISSSLFQLPIPGAEANGSNVLAFRNLVRAKFYDMPSGQSVANAYGLTGISAESLNLGPAWTAGTPLWFYVLAEASRIQGGTVLGPVGAFIVADVILRVLEIDKDSILRHRVTTFAPEASSGSFGLDDVLTFAGVASRP